IISDKPIGQAPNPIQMPEVSPPQTISGGITHGVSQFIVGFIPAVRATKFIKPLKNVGSWVKGMIAGSVTDFTVFSPHEERLSNLVQEFPELANPITEYLQAKPDDSFAEGRLKNSLEGIIAGGLAEPLTRSLRLLKYSRIKITGTEVRTKVHHKIEALEVELDEINWNNVVEKETIRNNSLLANANKELDQYIASLANSKYKPATAVGAVDPLTEKVVTASSGTVPTKIAPELQVYADKLGGLGVKTSCGNVLGACAEFRAANELLLNNPNLKLKDIQFTQAVRPRNGKPVSRCENCTNIFGVEK
ncbi:hypothetical protein ACGH47_10475, partial [Gilliamella sp. CG16]